MGVLLEIAKSPQAADTYSAQQKAANYSTLEAKRESLSGALSTLDHKRKGWDEAYEDDVTSRARYQQPTTTLANEREDTFCWLGLEERQPAKSQEESAAARSS